MSLNDDMNKLMNAGRLYVDEADAGWKFLRDLAIPIKEGETWWGIIARQHSELESLRSERARTEANEQPRSADNWHEDFGHALFFTEPIDEPPYCGTPLDDGFPWVSTPLALAHIRWVPLPRLFYEDGKRPSDAAREEA